MKPTLSILVALFLAFSIGCVEGYRKGRQHEAERRPDGYDVIGRQEDGALRLGCIADDRPPSVNGIALPPGPRFSIQVVCLQQGKSIPCASPLKDPPGPGNPVTSRCPL